MQSNMSKEIDSMETNYFPCFAIKHTLIMVRPTGGLKRAEKEKFSLTNAFMELVSLDMLGYSQNFQIHFGTQV